MDTDDRAGRLRRYVRFDVTATVAGAAATVAVWVWITRAGAVLVLAAVVLAAGLVMAGALAPLRRGDLARAVTWVAAGNWGAAVGVSVLAPFAMPVMTLTALLPAVLAVPYVTRRRLVAFIALSTAALMAAAVLSAQDVAGLGTRTPTWAQRGVVAAFLPLMAALVATTASQNADELRERLVAVLAANRRLRASELALAHQADELVASRARLATAADAERRRIERNLHDGAQQRLFAVAARLQAVRALGATTPGRTDAALDELATEVRAASADLRDLAHGLYPSVLADHGLRDALAAAVARSGLRCRLDLLPMARRSLVVESSVYFCCVEALHNAREHAGDGVTVELALRDVDGDLVFEVGDDGPGFDPTRTRRGRGLQNMADRVASLGGSFTVDAAPARGVRIRGRVPAVACSGLEARVSRVAVADHLGGDDVHPLPPERFGAAARSWPASDTARTFRVRTNG